MMQEIPIRVYEYDSYAERRAALLEILIKRDGLGCQYPGCTNPLDFDADPEGLDGVTFDHWMPQSWCIKQGWSESKTWDASNLRLMHKKCNAKKGDLVPNADGTLPERESKRKFRYSRDKKAQRPEVCEACNAGRNLDEGQWCNACGSGPQPLRTPKWRQMSNDECDHDLFFCAGCTIWNPSLRRSALDALITGGDGYE